MKSRFHIPRPRRSDSSLLPALAAAAMLVALAGQMLRPSLPVPDFTFGVAPSRLYNMVPTLHANISEILQKPLFSPSRRPEYETTTSPDPTQTNSRGMILVGTARTGPRISAFIRGEDGKLRRLQAGGEINGWQINWIGADKVKLRSGDQIRTLVAGEQTITSSPTGDETQNGEE